jgi:transcriptional regulator GlxA family with amidase domain
MGEYVDISNSLDVLQSNLSKTARVSEWAELMGYNCPRKFSRRFIRYYYVRPQKMLEYIRIKSILDDLVEGDKSNFEIAREHGIPDEIGLNKFVNYHLGCSPTDLKKMPDDSLKEKLNEKAEILGSKIR